METSITFIEKVLNGMSLADFSVYIIYALIGMLFNILLELKEQNYTIDDMFSSKFTTYFLTVKNRWLMCILIMPIGVLFTPQLTGQDLSTFTAFLAGLSSDRTLNMFFAKRIGNGTN